MQRLFILVALGFFLCGCATEYNLATGRKEYILISETSELRMGKSLSRQVEGKYKLPDDELVQQRVNEIGQRIARSSDRKDIPYHFKVLEGEEVNAFALPGGYIYVNKGLVDKLDTDDELAYILGHEVGHVAAKHSVKRIQGALGYGLLRILASKVDEKGKVGRGLDIAFGQIMLGYSREDELLADRLGVKYARKAGYDPEAAIQFLEKLREIEKKKPARIPIYLRTHPPILKRVEAVRMEISGEIDFEDYIGGL